MSAFSKVEDFITQKNTKFGHSKVNLENIHSLVKAKKEIKGLLVQQKNLKEHQLLISKDKV
jgi:hypothetical protein